MTTQTLPLPPLPPATPASPAMPASRASASTSSSIGIVASLTLAIWIICLTVGIWGLHLQYAAAHLPRADTPVVAQIIHVDLAKDSAPSSDDGGSAAPTPTTPDKIETLPPAIPASAAVPDAPPLTAVSVPDPAIVFAKPLEGPTRIVDEKQAAPAAPAPNAAGLVVHHLVYGKGEGAQPKPEYPREAILADQEGVVGVRFTVGENGRVLSADVTSASRFPMLNQAALRAVRDRWRFSPGEQRVYEVYIHYQLEKKNS